jgi:formylglycine-generating enzyme required for sulfatase activity
MFVPNSFGLYDMHGNLSEWCQDWFGSYTGEPVTDPTGPATGTYRVHRGGSWFHRAEDCRSATRNGNKPEIGGFADGFRLVVAAPRTP